MFANHKLDAVADTCPLHFVGRGDRVRVRVRQSKLRYPEVEMLTCAPFKMYVLDSDDGYRAANSTHLCLVTDPLPAAATAPIRPDLDVLPYQQGCPVHPIETQRGNGEPDVVAGVDWDMHIDQPQQQDSADNVLKHE